MYKKSLSFVVIAAFLAVEMSAGTADAQGMLKRMRTRFSRSSQTQCCPATCQGAAAPSVSASADVTPVSYSEPISQGTSCGESTVSESTACGESFSPCGTTESPITAGAAIEIPAVNSAPSCGCGSQVSLSTSIEPASVQPVPVQQVIHSGSFESGSFEAVPAVGCQSCGSIQPASYSEPIVSEPIVSGSIISAPITEGPYSQESGCVGCQSQVQGCSSGDCGSVVSNGGIVEGQIIEGEVISGNSVPHSSFIDDSGIQNSVIHGEIAPIESPSDVPEPPSQAPDVDDDQDA